MKRIFFLLTALVVFSIAYAKDIQELVVTTNPPMSCQNCENKIKGNLRFEKGVKKVETNIPQQKVTVEYDADKTTPEKIEAAFEKIGYNVKVIDSPNNDSPATQNKSNCTGTCCPSTKNPQK